MASRQPRPRDDTRPGPCRRLPDGVYPLAPTDPAWTEAALADLPALLADHLHCERKAATTALALVRAYPDRDDLVLHLSRLAHEETSHLVEVGRRLRRAGGQATRDGGDPYARALRAEVRRGEPAGSSTSSWSAGSSRPGAPSASTSSPRHCAPATRGSPTSTPGSPPPSTATGTSSSPWRAPWPRPTPSRSGSVALAAREAEVVATLPWGPRIH